MKISDFTVLFLSIYYNISCIPLPIDCTYICCYLLFFSISITSKIHTCFLMFSISIISKIHACFLMFFIFTILKIPSLFCFLSSTLKTCNYRFLHIAIKQFLSYNAKFYSLISGCEMSSYKHPPFSLFLTASILLHEEYFRSVRESCLPEIQLIFTLNLLKHLFLTTAAILLLKVKNNVL